MRAIKYVGYLRSTLGVGEAARGNVRALEAAGLEPELFDISAWAPSEKQVWRETELRQPRLDPEPDSINILHFNADQFFHLRESLAPMVLRAAYNVGVWAWETDRLPASWREAFGLVDEVWAGSRFMSRAIEAACPLPVVHVPYIVEVPEIDADRPAFGLDPGETVFLTMFDCFSSLARKNPAAAIEAFRRAFRPGESARLVLKSLNGTRHPELLARLRRQAAGLRVTFLDGAWDPLRRHRLLASCDAFVSLHRAEGFGLCIAEAMAHGKPAIVTAWSGNMDFTAADNAYLVEYRLHPLHERDHPYPPGTEWAQPDLDHAARHLREVHENPVAALQRGARARADVLREHSAVRIGELMRQRLEAVGAFDRLNYDHASRTWPAPTPLTLARRFLRSTFRGLRRVAPRGRHAQLVRIADGLKRRLGYRG